jgi:pyruvate/2-oxoglutarate dehydrogenase complex dihydrolipoamide acyltransferase (E2) component
MTAHPIPLNLSQASARSSRCAHRARLGRGGIQGFQKVECPYAGSNLSGSVDHRVVDGAIFIQCIRDYLEHPAMIFI